ncbi:hypothetical protein NK8_05040 [Caballeronia sp. NK8]|uniref:three component ABC system middle component n=1 Tax=Caballeronia sp. NK8 TaxID=140098 RepID=UPI001BB5CB50|nr:three component ABC system middle component [Caballeronia sp. NK8]BCQ22395.1 hypothetical protein NK8_05040 [Caballeronia sp. NK8]
MIERWSGYNNVGICATALLAVMAHAPRLSLPKAMLVMPLVMHDATVKHLGNGSVARRAAATLAASRPDLFINFDSRFTESLVTSVNAIQLVIEAQYVRFDGELVLVNPVEIDPSFGRRAQRITKAAEHIAALLKSPADELYLNFRVKL